MKKILILIGIISLTLFQCKKPAPETTADTLYVNGHILTMEAAFPEVEAMAVGDGIILSIGESSELKTMHPQAEVIDLEGQWVMPGIIESHGHLLSLGQSFIELNVEGVSSPEEVIHLVQQRAQETPEGQWIVGWGWDDGAWAKAYPDNKELSKASPHNPVYLRGLHGFASWANNQAMEIAGITKATPNPPNGEILKDSVTAIPTGILTNSAQDLLTAKVPSLTQEQMQKALQLALDECLKYGLTSVHEARTTRSMLEALQALKDQNKLKCRIYTMLDWTEEDLLEEYFLKGPIKDPDNMLTILCVKIFVDGALGSRGAAMLAPYSDAPGETGLVVTTEGRVYELTKRSLQTGFQVAVHAIGDKANRITLDALARALKAVPDVRDHRLRVEHAQIVAPEDIPRFAPLGIVLSMQPPHCTSDMPWAEIRVGPERILGAYAWRSILDTGVHMTLNSDFPGETLNPFYGMYAALTRQNPAGEPAGGWYPDQKLTRDEVLRAYTVEAAYSEFAENIKGKLLPGMLADFIILSDDIRTIPIPELLNLEVKKTYVGGQLVYSKE